MQNPQSHKKQVRKIHRWLYLWETFFSFIFTAIIITGVGFRYYTRFSEGMQQQLFIGGLAFCGLLSFSLIKIFLSVWDNRALRKMFREPEDFDAYCENKRRMAIPVVERERNVADAEEVVQEKKKHTKKKRQDTFITDVSTLLPNTIEFETTELTQTTSANREDMYAENIKQRLLEKETRIIEIIDIHLGDKVDNRVGFSATIFVSAQTLLTAADIVDSANTILEDEFNIKNTRLIPVIAH